MASGVQSSVSASSIPPRIAAALRGLRVISASCLTNVSFADKGLLMGWCVGGNESPPPALFPTASLPEMEDLAIEELAHALKKTTPTPTNPAPSHVHEALGVEEGLLGTKLEGIAQRRCVPTSWYKSIHPFSIVASPGLQESAGVYLSCLRAKAG